MATGAHLARALGVPRRLPGGKESTSTLPERQPQVPRERARARALRLDLPRTGTTTTSAIPWRSTSASAARSSPSSSCGWLHAWRRSEPGSRVQQGAVRSPSKASRSRSRTRTIRRARSRTVGSSTSASRPGRPRARGRVQDLLRRRHERLRRHVSDRADLLPDRGCPPIGDHYNDGPARGGGRARASASSAAFPVTTGRSLLTGTPAALRELAPAGVEVLEPAPGETLAF